MKLNVLKIVCFSLALFFNGLLNPLLSQNYKIKDGYKTHYEIKNLNSYSNPDNVVIAAEECTSFDKIRYIDKRRSVRLKNSDVIIELYSALELKEMYGKEVCLLNIDSNKLHTEVELIFVNSKHPIFEIIEIK
ncbi:MAG: hypothetical protein IT232_01700 [Flavobacteriales bacterium]|nr:hypothetical protein [Flavobacteriales bacterium]